VVPHVHTPHERPVATAVSGLRSTQQGVARRAPEHTSRQIALSIVILSYNTRSFTIDCLQSIKRGYEAELSRGEFELIVADNASTDGSPKALREYGAQTAQGTLRIIDNGGNIGFAAGNNNATAFARGRYVMFLNPDTVVYPRTLTYLIEFMDCHPEAGAATCRLVGPDGALDETCHRGFPTPWNAFCHFSGLERRFPHSRLFASYTQGWKDFNRVHEVDAAAGAFLIVRREAGERIGWWDEDYFFYGEDLQFCYDLRKAGYKIYYIPEVASLHYGGVASGIKRYSRSVTTADCDVRANAQTSRFDAMRIFYRKNYSDAYPRPLAWLVEQGIRHLQRRDRPA
jgi:GT2 family glycosyltransferase